MGLYNLKVFLGEQGREGYYDEIVINTCKYKLLRKANEAIKNLCKFNLVLEHASVFKRMFWKQLNWAALKNSPSNPRWFINYLKNLVKMEQKYTFFFLEGAKNTR